MRQRVRMRGSIAMNAISRRIATERSAERVVPRAGNRIHWLPSPPLGTALALFVVVNVSVDFTGDVPGVTVSGLNEHVVPGGSVAPLQDNAMGLVNEPTCGATVTLNVADCPAVSVALAGETSTEKSVTVIARSVDAEKPTPLLLADP